MVTQRAKSAKMHNGHDADENGESKIEIPEGLLISYRTHFLKAQSSESTYKGMYKSSIEEVVTLITRVEPTTLRLRFLKVSDAYMNGFLGPLPQELIKLPSLEQLDLGRNCFSGRIPPSNGNFKRLKFLILAG
ncbi:LRR receptor-like kinase, putative [Medicago truncatula]|uniref:LRR receptor-like kinase, putative n=1 Tax=Medicago truncatula TaxID=3880 RepID=G7J0F0_MEDTR|nr:LRR receptor-like kinase, putative [Medicago truncatula]